VWARETRRSELADRHEDQTKIKSIETFSNEFVAFVRVTADDASQGWGSEISAAWLEEANRQVSTLG
jgi:hypothetical protein